MDSVGVSRSTFAPSLHYYQQVTTADRRSGRFQWYELIPYRAIILSLVQLRCFPLVV